MRSFTIANDRPVAGVVHGYALSPTRTCEMTQPEARTPFLDLSLPQLVAGAVAAATAGILSSQIGLLGTVVGVSRG